MQARGSRWQISGSERPTCSRHPRVLEEYRAAHSIAERHATAGVETEDLRQAMVHYRALFDDLLETESATPEQEPAAGNVQTETTDTADKVAATRA